MKMPILILTISSLATIVSLRAAGQSISLKTDLNVTYESDISETDDYEGGTVDCDPFGDGKLVVYPTQRSQWASSAGNGVYSTPTQIKYSLTQIGSEGGPAPAREMSLAFLLNSPTDKTEKSTAKVVLSDEVAPAGRTQADHKCRRKIMNMKYVRSTTNGTIAFNYTVPERIWLIKVDIESSGDLSSKLTRPFDGALKTRMLIDSTKQQFYIWAKPGSTVSLPFKFDNITPGRALQGIASISVEPVITRQLSDSEFAETMLKPIRNNPSEIVAAFDNWGVEQPPSGPTTNNELRTLENLSRLVSSSQLRKEVIRHLTLQKFDNLITRLNSDFVFEGTANGDKDPSRPNSLFWETKAMASFATFLLAQDFLTGLAPYCEDVKMETPVEGEYRQVKAIKIVWYYLAQVQTRLNNYKFSNYRAMFAEIREFEKSAMTYDQVMRDRALTDKLRRAYQVLANSDLSKLPFRAIAGDLKFVSKKFPALTTDIIPFASVLQKIEHLGQIEAPFVKATMLRFAEFRLGNKKPVKITDLDADLDELQEGYNIAKSDLPNAIPFLSLEPNSYSSLEAFVRGLTNTNIALLTSPLEALKNSSGQVVELEFEKLRQGFIQVRAPNSTLDMIKKCQE